MKKGVLLINLGTPDSPSTKDVRRYLREFLSDPYVIDINPIARWFLVNLIIAPFRSPKSAEAYQSIWMEKGSPLLYYSKSLTQKVQNYLGDDFVLRLAMRYGNPSIESQLLELKEMALSEILVLPLYPQYALSSTKSSIEKVKELAIELDLQTIIKSYESFYEAPEFVEPLSKIAQPLLKSFNPDHILFSYHGLPERHVIKTDPTGAHCLKKKNCCDMIGQANQNCYRAHCVHTTKALVRSLELKEEDYTLCFQSRLGRTPWLKPYTDLLIEDLAKKGKKRLAVFCPAFVADCLETLEEIQIRGKELFIENGGEDLLLIPAVNDNDLWVVGISKLIQRNL